MAAAVATVANQWLEWRMQANVSTYSAACHAVYRFRMWQTQTMYHTSSLFATISFVCFQRERENTSIHQYVSIYIHIFISQLYQFCNQFSSIAFHTIYPGNRSNVQARKCNVACSPLFFPMNIINLFWANSIKSIPMGLPVCVYWWWLSQWKLICFIVK